MKMALKYESRGFNSTYQCPVTLICKNDQCFWRQRDQFGLSPFFIVDIPENQELKEKQRQIRETYGESYFPEHEVIVLTNVMGIKCLDYKDK